MFCDKKEGAEPSLLTTIALAVVNRSTFGATGSERETRPKGFDERINVYTYDFLSDKREKSTYKHLSIKK